MSQDTVEGSDRALVAHDDEVSGLGMCVYVNERGRGSQPDSTDDHLDQGVNGNDIVRRP